MRWRCAQWKRSWRPPCPRFGRSGSTTARTRPRSSRPARPPWQSSPSAVELSLASARQRLDRTGESDIWTGLSEADLRLLVSSRPPAVANGYRKALAGKPDFAVNSARQQLELYRQLGVRAANVDAALAVFPPADPTTAGRAAAEGRAVHRPHDRRTRPRGAALPGGAGGDRARRHPGGAGGRAGDGGRRVVRDCGRSQRRRSAVPRDLRGTWHRQRAVSGTAARTVRRRIRGARRAGLGRTVPSGLRAPAQTRAGRDEGAARLAAGQAQLRHLATQQSMDAAQRAGAGAGQGHSDSIVGRRGRAMARAVPSTWWRRPRLAAPRW